MPAELLSVSIVACMYFLASTAIKVLLPLSLSAMGTPVTEIGLVVGAQAFLPMLLAVPSGALADKIGFKKMIILGGAGMCIASVLYYFPTQMLVLLAAQLLMGVAELSVWLSSQAVATQIGQGKARGNAMGFFGFLVAFGQAIAPTIAGFTADAVGFRNAMLLALLFSIGTLVAGFLMPSRSFVSKAEMGLMDQFRAAGEISRSPGVQAGLICTFTMIFTRTVRSSFFPVYLSRTLGYSAASIGILVSTMETSSTLVRLLLGKLLEKISKERMLIAGMFVGIVATAITPLIPHYSLLMLAAAISGVGLGLNLPLTMMIISDEAPKHLKGLAIGIRMTGNRAAQLVSPLVFGILGRWLALEPSFYVVGLGLLGSNALTAVLLAKSKAQASAGSAA